MIHVLPVNENRDFKDLCKVPDRRMCIDFFYTDLFTVAFIQIYR
jgi:hypothetical protein